MPKPHSRRRPRPSKVLARLRRHLRKTNPARTQRNLQIDPASSNPTEALQRAIDRSWPSRHHSRYRGVYVLLTCWADGGGVADPARSPTRLAWQLADMFAARYGFRTQVWLIPTVASPQQALAAKLSQFAEAFGAPDTLLIFWYAGPALPSDGHNGVDVWYGREQDPGIAARIVPQILGASRSDVLTLYDCGYSLYTHDVRGGSSSSSPSGGPAVFEALGARAGYAEPGPFSRLLLRVLDSPFAAAQGLAAVDLHRKLVNLGRTGSRNSPASVYSSWSSAAGGGGTCDCPRRLKDPTYCQLTSSRAPARGGHRSIVLSRLGAPLVAFPRDPGVVPRVVKLRLGLNRDKVDVEAWEEWLRKAPPEVENVAVI
ncbi:hypothetical protein F4780DRAFT_50174 [Xylariomycetidae sp. FL0641]|nr:hypothetical protein F4780DRAFT_50174 [Xylariomycetidae sp. FL0641]